MELIIRLEVGYERFKGVKYNVRFFRLESRGRKERPFNEMKQMSVGTG